LFMIQGYIGKHIFKFSWSIHLLLHFLVQLPFTWHVIVARLRDTPWVVDVFMAGWYGLIAEPTRLILMIYSGTDAVSLIASFIFVAMGRKVEIADEQQIWEQARNRIKVG